MKHFSGIISKERSWLLIILLVFGALGCAKTDLPDVATLSTTERNNGALLGAKSAIGATFDSRIAQLADFARRKSDESSALSESCLAFSALEERDNQGIYKPQLLELANGLVAMKDLNHDGRVGWGVSPNRTPKASCKKPGQLDAFRDGTCNDAKREYMFDTGLAVMCLARAYLITRETAFIEVAQKALDDSWEIGTAPQQCPNCWVYWYSYDTNDVGRYVRNSNVLMGAAVAWVWKATGKEKYRHRAKQIVATEAREAAMGNLGYFGIDDSRYRSNPQRESHRVENHLPWVAKGLHDIGLLFDDQAVLNLAHSVQDSWQNCTSSWTCGDNCRIWAANPQRCKESITASPCFFKTTNPRYASLCNLALPALLRGGLTPTMWWALADK